MNDKKKIILSNIFKYSSAQYFSQFLGFFTAILIRRILGPFSMGIWSMLKVIMGYTSYTNLGSTYTVTYNVPILKGEGKHEEATKLISVVFNFITITAFICSLCIAVYALVLGRSLPKEIFVGLLALSIILLSQRVYTYYLILLRAHKDFGILSKAIAFDAVINLSLVLLVVNRFHLYGLYAIIIFTPILNVIFIRKYVTYNLKFSFCLKNIIFYIKYGAPLFVIVLLDRILHSIDKIMIASMLGLEQLGFYSIVVITENYGAGIAQNLSTVIQPYFLENFDANGMQKSSIHIMLYSQITAYFMAIVLSLIFICGPTLVAYILPAFIPGVTALQIFLIAIFFFSILPYSSNFIVAIQKQTKLIPIATLSILINVLFNYVFISKGFGIKGAALATAISAFLSFCIVSSYALRHCERKTIIIKFFVKTLFPVFYCILGLAIIGCMIRMENLFLETILKVFVFVLFMIPLISYLNKKTGIVKVMWKSLVEKVFSKDKNSNFNFGK